MRKKKDVQHELSQLSSDIRALQGNKEKETEYRSALEKMRTLTDELNEINTHEAAERALADSKLDKETAQAARQFSFAKFLRELGEEGGSLTGVEKEMADLAREEANRSSIKLKGTGIPMAVLGTARDFGGQNVTTPADGGLLVATHLNYQESLRKRLVLAQAGATYLAGLSGNISFIEGSQVTGSWEGENDLVEDSKKQFKERTFSPKRVAINVPISKQLVAQSSFDVERMVIDTLIAAHAEKIESAAINGSGTGQPLGVLNTEGIGSVVIGANGGALTYGKIVDLETAIATKDADLGRMGYITTPGVRGFGKQTLRNASVSGYIWEGKEMNGYPAFVSNIVPSNITKGTGENLHALLFGNWADLIIGQWGVLDLVVDPFSLKKYGALEITLNAYHDVFVKRKESFAAIKDIKIG